MPNLGFKLLPALVISFCLGLPCQAQVGTPRYNFKNRAEVESATRKHKLNLRESYNIIMCARRQGLLKSVVKVYEQEIGNNKFDVPPQLSSSFALAHEMLRVPVRWDWKWDQASGITNLGDADGIRITFYRDRALRSLPKSPEVLLGYALWTREQNESAKSLKFIQQAVKLAPNWADLQWWYARILGFRLSSMSAAEHEKYRVRYGLLQIQALGKAQRLDPFFKRENYSSLAYAYYDARRYKEALDAFDMYVRLRPDYKEYLGERRYQRRRTTYIEAMQIGS